MIVTSAAELLAAYPERIEARGPWGRPTMSAAMLVSPIGFRISGEPVDNLYMQTGAIDRERAFAQHHALLAALGACGLPVVRLARAMMSGTLWSG